MPDLLIRMLHSDTGPALHSAKYTCMSKFIGKINQVLYGHVIYVKQIYVVYHLQDCRMEMITTSS